MATTKQIEQANHKIEAAISRRNSANEDIFSMTINSKDDAVRLKGMLSEAVAALQVAKDEREHLGDICDVAAEEFGGNTKEDKASFKKVFKKTASLVFKGKLDEENHILEECQELYDQVSSIV